MRKTIFLLAAIAALPLLAPTHALAREYPWCAQYSGDDGPAGTNCGFQTFAQCQATVRGVGGYCEQNPRFSLAQAPRRHRH